MISDKTKYQSIDLNSCIINLGINFMEGTLCSMHFFDFVIVFVFLIHVVSVCFLFFLFVIQMKLLVVSILCAFFLVSSQNPTSHWTLQPNGIVHI